MNIAVIGNRRHFNLEDYSVRALENLGHQVQFLGFNDINGKKYSELLRMLTTRSATIRRLSDPFWLDRINEKYMRSLTKFQPEIVLSIKGESVQLRTLKYISDELGAKTALWSPDDPRFFRSLFKHIAPFYDYVFSYSSQGVKLYRDIGVEGAFRLLFGCDNAVHKRYNLANKPLDKALFIGTFSPKRFRLLKKLIKNGIKVDIAGRYWKEFLPSNTISDGIYGVNLSKMYQKYKFAINIHNDERYGPNMRTFEVTGSAGALMSDMAEDMSNLFKEGKEVFVYSDVEELIKLINGNTLSDEYVSEVASNGYLRAHKSYTYNETMTNFVRIVSGKS